MAKRAKPFHPVTKLERDLVSYVRATRTLLELLHDLSEPRVPEAKPAKAPDAVTKKVETLEPARKVKTKRRLG